MQILIVSATPFEIEPLIEQFHFVKEINQKLKSYTYNNHEIDVLITGVGMTSTAFCLGKTLSREAYELALNFGIAGSFDDTITIGQTVNVMADCISELGAEDGESFLTLGDLNLSDEEAAFKNITTFDNSAISKLTAVKGITVNTTHGTISSINKIRDLFNPQVESMEGAAFLYACVAESVNCFQIRTISNKVEKRNKDNWDIPLAINNLCKTGIEIIDSL